MPSTPVATRTLTEFLNSLEYYRERVPLDVLVREVAAIDVSLGELDRYCVFDPKRYRRNLIRGGRAYQALVLCWRSGQRSPIHDHTGASCAVRVLKGTLTETIFDRTPEGLVYATRSHELHEGGVCGSEDSDIHQVSNLQASGSDLVTLHVYSPGLDAMNVYSLTDRNVKREIDPVYEYALGAGI